MNNLSRETNKKLDELVCRVARKAGYNGGELTYQEHLQQKMESVRKKLSAKYERQKHKFGFGTKNGDFAEEIKTYLADSIAEHIREGHSEAEALRRTMEQFDEAELRPDFESFMKEFDDFGIEQAEWYTKNGEAIGLFFAAFLLLGLPVGAIAGYFIAGTLIAALIGAAAGAFLGIGCGMLKMAVMVAKRD